MKTNLRRSIASLLIVSIIGLGLPLPVQAGMVSTEASVAADRDRIAAMLDRSDVRAQLEARGVNADDAKARVAALTDEEAAKLAAEMDALPAGGDPFNTAIFLLAMAVLIPVLVVMGVIVLVKKVAGGPKQISRDFPPTPAGQEQEVRQ